MSEGKTLAQQLEESARYRARRSFEHALEHLVKTWGADRTTVTTCIVS